MKDYKKYHVWRAAHELVKTIYRVTNDFPKSELYGITSQLRRACISIPNNFAEGCGRNSDAELRRFIIIASGSASEVEYLLLLSYELHYLTLQTFNELNTEIIKIKKMLTALKNKL